MAKTDPFHRGPPTVELPRLGHARAHNHGPTERPKRAAETVGRLWRYLRRERRALLITGVLVAGTVGLDLAGPLLLRQVIDRFILTRSPAGLGAVLALMVAVYGLSAGLNLLQSYVMAGAAQRTIRQLRTDLFDRLLRLPLGFFDQRVQGELMARLTSDVESVNQVLSNSITQIVSGALSTLAIAIAMFAINARLAAISVVTISVLTIAVNRWLSARTRARFREQQAALGRLYGEVEEAVGGQKVTKAYGRELAAVAKFEAVNQPYRDAGVAAQSISGMTGPLMTTVNSVAVTLVAVAGGLLAIRGLTTIGTIAAFINYIRQFGRPLNEIANLYNALQSALAGAERIFEVIDEPLEPDAPAVEGSRRLQGDVRFEGVGFSYRREVPVLKNLSLHARPGQTVALIGPTGAGKTTVVNLLTRFYELDEGRIVVDGVDLREHRKADLRRQLGIVLQDTFLFSTTVMENIRYGRLEASDAEVIEAARQANADTFIHRLPQGYQTVLNERGANLSHGQRQMVAIARAILANPAILILDEATSSVDTRTEKHIQEAMARLMRGRTSFVIAHRLSTIREADQIIVIDHGEIAERGTHAELMAQQGYYWRVLLGRRQLVTGREGGAPRVDGSALLAEDVR